MTITYQQLAYERRCQISALKKSGCSQREIAEIIGKGHSGALVAIVELVTKHTVSAQVNSKSATDVTTATISVLNPFKDIVHTITADKGKEFSHHEKIIQALSAEVYFAHPYSSWEQGLNEHTDGLLRQYFPKNTDFKKVGQIEVKRALMRLNSRPRKDLDFKTSALIMGEHRAALAA
ncbi:MAG: IS30 family transposase [Candidatus Endonucleobacter sp. (ex Gigantidas childressi)]|nr:IS30 family transposase [Candidatus Endonucleobacter sp. (ex Gigantidas childressi)]